MGFRLHKGGRGKIKMEDNTIIFFRFLKEGGAAVGYCAGVEDSFKQERVYLQQCYCKLEIGFKVRI